MKKALLAALAATTMLAASQPASAITWTDWTSVSGNTVSGTVGGVGVTYSGSHGTVQLNSPETDYYVGNAFTGYKPDNTDIIELIDAGQKSITFGSTVQDVYLALVSWNVPGTQSFDHAFSVAVEGCGYWGCGSITVLPGDMSFVPGGELHGVLKFAGPIDSLTFTDGSENWHGITVGVGSPFHPAVPEPATWAMMIGGFALAGAALRRRTATVRFA